MAEEKMAFSRGLQGYVSDYYMKLTPEERSTLDLHESAWPEAVFYRVLRAWREAKKKGGG